MNFRDNWPLYLGLAVSIAALALCNDSERRAHPAAYEARP